VQVRCGHLATIDPDRPAPVDVCPACVALGSLWVHLRQCLECGATNCCDSSPNRHATAHFHASGHPVMQTLEPDEDWAWCFVDKVTMEPEDGTWTVVDPFFDAGVWYARAAIKAGATVPFPAGMTGQDGFPLHMWELTYRGRHRSGTLDPDQQAELEAIPGWHW
jgi:hypothetical protein